MERLWGWLVADIRGEHSTKRPGPTPLENSLSTPVLTLLLVAGTLMWMSNLFVHESRPTDTLTEMVGGFAALWALAALRRRRKEDTSD